MPKKTSEIENNGSILEVDSSNNEIVTYGKEANRVSSLSRGNVEIFNYHQEAIITSFDGKNDASGGWLKIDQETNSSVAALYVGSINLLRKDIDRLIDYLISSNVFFLSSEKDEKPGISLSKALMDVSKATEKMGEMHVENWKKLPISKIFGSVNALAGIAVEVALFMYDWIQSNSTNVLKEISSKSRGEGLEFLGQVAPERLKEILHSSNDPSSVTNAATVFEETEKNKLLLTEFNIQIQKMEGSVISEREIIEAEILKRINRNTGLMNTDRKQWLELKDKVLPLLKINNREELIQAVSELEEDFKKLGTSGEAFYQNLSSLVRSRLGESLKILDGLKLEKDNFVSQNKDIFTSPAEIIDETLRYYQNLIDLYGERSSSLKEGERINKERLDTLKDEMKKLGSIKNYQIIDASMSGKKLSSEQSNFIELINKGVALINSTDDAKIIEEKTKEIRAAYDLLLKNNGFEGVSRLQGRAASLLKLLEGGEKGGGIILLQEAETEFKRQIEETESELHEARVGREGARTVSVTDADSVKIPKLVPLYGEPINTNIQFVLEKDKDSQEGEVRNIIAPNSPVVPIGKEENVSSSVVHMPITIHAPNVGTNELADKIVKEVEAAIKIMISRNRAQASYSDATSWLSQARGGMEWEN